MALNFLTMDLASVTVRVGEADASADITVYRDILSAVSPYFRGAFEGSFVEATDRLISLTDVTEQTFRMFLQWTQIQAQNKLLPSGTIVPPPGIILQDSTPEKCTDKTTAVPTESRTADLAQGGSDAKSRPSRRLALDNNGADEKSLYRDEMEQLYYANPKWVDGYHLSLVSFLRLYIFADKYNVHQLRDDVLTALIAQSTSWCWWPDPERQLISFAYANLSPSSKFIRLLILSTAYYWVSEPATCSATRLRILKEMHEEFAFEVGVVLLQRVKGKDKMSPSTTDGIPFRQEKAVSDSCMLHEHLAQDAGQCRKRIYDQPYIFTGLIEMCAQDALSMAKESDEE